MKRLACLLILLAACTEEPPPPPPVQPLPTKATEDKPKPASEPVAPQPKTVTSGPRVVAVTGEGLVDGVIAVVGLPVTLSSILETRANSKLTISLGPGNVISIRESSRVELGKSPRKETSVKLLAGAIWSFLPKKSSFEVVAPNAVAGVRGTIFFVQASSETDSYICDCDGEVEMTVGKKKKVLKSKMAHTGMKVKGDAAKAKPSPEKKPINHTKEEAVELAKLAETMK